MKIGINSLVAVCMLAYASADTTCDKGKFYVYRSRRRRAARSACYSCVPGYWQREANHKNKSCQPCPSGKYTDNPGSSKCLGGPVCQTGTVGIIGAVSENESVCNDCVAGRYSVNTGDGPDCMSCPSGLYVATSKASSCIGGGACPLGKYGTMFNTKQGTCKECPVGKITVKTGLFTCSDCPRGQYQLSSGKSSCLPKENCTRWKINQPNAYECVYVYNIDFYISLVILSWISVLLTLKVWLIALEPCVSWNTILLIITFSVSVWLSTFHPVNLDSGMTDASFGCLAAFVVITIFARIDYILVDKYGKNYVKSICKKETKADGTVQIHVDTPNKVYV